MLDVSLRAGILRLMLDLREQRQVACLFITHDLSLAWVVADRIAVVYLGRIVEIGPSAEVIAHPKHPYTKALVSVIPVPVAGAAADQILLVGETPSARSVPPGCRFHPRCWRYEALGRPEACLTDDPTLGAGTHGVACHFALDEEGGTTVMTNDAAATLLADLVRVESVTPWLIPDRQRRARRGRVHGGLALRPAGGGDARRDRAGPREPDRATPRDRRRPDPLGINAHADTVGYANWADRALNPAIDGDIMVGLGVADDKSGCAAALLALRSLV